MKTLKENLAYSLGTFGIILAYLLGFLFESIILVFPVIMIGMKWWLILLLSMLEQFFPIVTPILWIWGLVCAIIGPQSWVTIAYYILFISYALYIIGKIFYNKR